MTNKMPVVGRKYRFKLYKIEDSEIEVIAVTNSFVVFLKKYNWGADKDIRHCGKLVFFQYYEELPEDKTEIKPETQIHISELSPEVKEAMENLKYHSRITDYFDKESALEEIKYSAKNLLDALNKQFFMPKEE